MSVWSFQHSQNCFQRRQSLRTLANVWSYLDCRLDETANCPIEDNDFFNISDAQRLVADAITDLMD